MDCINLNPRNGKKSSELRKEGNVPGVIYGKDKIQFLFEISELELSSNLKKYGGHGVMNVKLNGISENALIKEIQRDPVTHKVIHIDFEAIEKDAMVTTEVPLYFENEGLIKSNGGILQKEKLSVKVQGKADSIPSKINVDIGKLKIGDTLRVFDLEIANELSFMDALETNILSVTSGSYIEEDSDSNAV